MIKGIIFDLDGVYFKNGTSNFLDIVASRYRKKREDASAAYLKSEEMKRYKEGKMTGKEYWNWFISTLGIDTTRTELLEMMKAGYEMNPKAHELMEKTRKKGLRAIICSNNFPERIELLDARFRFKKDFDHIILSYEQGLLKPELLNKVPEITGLKPDEILLIDDGASIIAAAKELGFKTILCEKPDELLTYLRRQGIEL